MEQRIFKQDAKQIVDLMFDHKLFKDQITRDDMNNLQDTIEYMLSSRFETYQRVKELMQKIKSK